MLNKYNDEFRRMYESIIQNRRNPLEVISESHLFKSEEMSVSHIVSYLGEYIREKEF